MDHGILVQAKQQGSMVKLWSLNIKWWNQEARIWIDQEVRALVASKLGINSVCCSWVL